MKFEPHNIHACLLLYVVKKFFFLEFPACDAFELEGFDDDALKSE